MDADTFKNCVIAFFYRGWLVFFGIALCGVEAGAQWPASNIYVFNVVYERGEPRLIQPRYLTADNATGYNNQPHFHNNTLYISSASADDRHTDIWELDVVRGIRSRLTQTPVSEFSPKTHAAFPDRLFTIVIEQDGSTQRLWEYPLRPRRHGIIALPQPLDAGYYEWLGRDRIAIFRANDSLSTEIARVYPAYRVMHTFTDVGRCFQYLGNNLLAAVRSINGTAYLGTIHVETGHWEPIISMPGNSVDFVRGTNGHYWAGSGSSLYTFNPHRHNQWQRVADLSEYGITGITRLALSVSGLLALVDQPE